MNLRTTAKGAANSDALSAIGPVGREDPEDDAEHQVAHETEKHGPFKWWKLR